MKANQAHRKNSLRRRSLGAGAPTALASAIMILLPISGRAYLSDSDYAVWALASTVMTVTLLFDFGGPLLATRLAARTTLSGRSLAVISAATATGSAAVGLVAVVLWAVLAERGTVVSGSLDQYYLLAGIIFGSCLRSIVAVYAGVALGRQQMALRAGLLLGLALSQAGVTVLSLMGGAGLWALPLGLLIASGTLLILAVLSIGSDTQVLEPAAATIEELKLFARSKLVGTSIGIFVSQADRWVLAAVGSAAFLASYDLAARFAAIPKLLIVAFSASLVGESARLSHEPELIRTAARRALVGASAFGLFAAPLGWIALYFLWASDSFPLGSAFPAIFAALLTAQTVNGLTAPGTLILSGLGIPQYELRYLLVLMALAASGYTFSVVTGSSVAVVATVASSLTISSLYFLWRLPAYITLNARSYVVRTDA